MKFALLIQRLLELLDLSLFLEKRLIVKAIKLILQSFIISLFTDELRKFVDFGSESRHKLVGFEFNVLLKCLSKLLLSIEEALFRIEGGCVHQQVIAVNFGPECTFLLELLLLFYFESIGIFFFCLEVIIQKSFNYIAFFALVILIFLRIFLSL